MNLKLLDIATRQDEGKGSLSFFEACRDIPFEVKRVYYTYGVPQNVKRGGHAHRALKQLLFCPFGSIEVILDDGVSKESVLLDRPNMGLIVGSMVWRDMVWKKDSSVLVVAASDFYSESDYIRNYDDFLSMVDSEGDRLR